MEIKRGDIIDIDFDPARGHEMKRCLIITFGVADGVQ